VYESKHPILVEDGLYASLEALGQRFLIKKINIATEALSCQKGDFILGWGAFGSKVDILCGELTNKKGLCIGGCSDPVDTLRYDVLFYETKWFREKIKFHPNIVHAFGVNTDIYYDMKLEKRDIDYLGVGAFAKWKRWEKMLRKKGNRRVIGEYQVDNSLESEEIWRKLEAGGVFCKDMISAKTLNCEYNRAKTVYIPATIMGGGERAVLEARQCGCQVEIEKDNPKLEELLTCPIYDTAYYITQLNHGIRSCL